MDAFSSYIRGMEDYVLFYGKVHDYLIEAEKFRDEYMIQESEETSCNKVLCYTLSQNTLHHISSPVMCSS